MSTKEKEIKQYMLTALKNTSNNVELITSDKLIPTRYTNGKQNS